VHGSAKLHWLSTLRARAGVAMGDFLPFVTAGAAFGRVSVDGKAKFSGEDGVGGGTEPCHSVVSLGRSKTMVGYTVGAGLDYRLSDRTFLNLTYLYVNLGKLSTSASYSGTRSDGEGNTSSVSGK